MGDTCSNCGSVKGSITKARIILKNNFSPTDKNKLIKSKQLAKENPQYAQGKFVIIGTDNINEQLNDLVFPLRGKPCFLQSIL